MPYVPGGTISGCLTSDPVSGIASTNAWNPWFDISWSVTSLLDNTFRYDYTMRVDEAELSHWILELSDGCTFANNCLISVTANSAETEVKIHTEGEGNPGLPSSIYGIKINFSNDSLEQSVSIVSDRVPVYQNFYAKDGGGVGAGSVHAYNNGFDGSGTYFLPGPDTRPLQEIPEPGFYIPLVMGMVWLSYIAYRRHKAAA